MTRAPEAKRAEPRRRNPRESAVPCEGMRPVAKRRAPKMGLHKTSGQARVVLNGQEHYLGVFGTTEAAENYATLLRQWEDEGRRALRQLPTVVQAVVTVRSLFDQFLAHADSTGRYQRRGEAGTHRQRFEWVKESLATALNNPPVAKLTEESLVAWRDVLERDRHRTRGGINKLVSFALLVLRWGRTRGLVPRHVFVFAGSMCGGRAAAVIYTLIECCRLTKVDMLAYLADVLVRVASHPASRIDELLPANWAANFASPAAAPVLA
jgi:hypothetical protein